MSPIVFRVRKLHDCIGRNLIVPSDQSGHLAIINPKSNAVWIDIIQYQSCVTNLLLLVFDILDLKPGSFRQLGQYQHFSINEVADSVSQDTEIVGLHLFRCLLVPKIGCEARVLQITSHKSIRIQCAVFGYSSLLTLFVYIFLRKYSTLKIVLRLSFNIEKPSIEFDSFIFKNSWARLDDNIFTATETSHHCGSKCHTLVSVQHVIWWLSKVLFQKLTHYRDSC